MMTSRDIVGVRPAAPDFWRDVQIDGFLVATHRRVVARIGATPIPLLSLDARFGPPRVTFDG